MTTAFVWKGRDWSIITALGVVLFVLLCASIAMSITHQWVAAVSFFTVLVILLAIAFPRKVGA